MNSSKRIEKIQNALYDWRKERRLDLRGQLAGLYKNIIEELNELKEAKDDCERIDAICDIAVFSFNALGEFKRDLVISHYGNKTLESFSQAVKNRANEADGLFREIDEFIMVKGFRNDADYKMAKDKKYKWEFLIWEIIIECWEMCDQLGFDFLKAMDETIKEISSRTGHWDEIQNKFIKDNRGTYFADYKKCKKKVKS